MKVDFEDRDSIPTYCTSSKLGTMECYPCPRRLLKKIGFWDPQMNALGYAPMIVLGYPQMNVLGYPQMNVLGYPK